MFHNQVILITGTRQSIGLSLVKYFVEKGLQVIGCSRKTPDYAYKNYQHFCLDISDETQVKQMFAEIRKNYERLDVLINNAGLQSIQHVLLTSKKTVQEIFDTNLIGTFLLSREASKLMKKKSHGRIVNISSIAVPLANIGSSVYSASKAATEQFSRVLAKEVASSGITVNTLGLSVVSNSGMHKNLSKEAIADALAGTILKAPIDFQDIAHAIEFFISPKSKMVTSQTIYLGGV